MGKRGPKASVIKPQLTCINCGKSYVSSSNYSKERVQQFCSHNCCYQHRRKPKPWLDEALRLYQSGTGVKRIGKALGVRPQTILLAIKRTHHFQPGREKTMPRWNKGVRSQRAINDLIMDQYKSDAHKLQRFDELKHWLSHPLVKSWDSWGKIKSNPTLYAAHIKRVCRRIADREKRDIGYKLMRRLRRRLWLFVKRGQRAESMEKLVGCDRDGLVKHLERHFKPGMTLENYGSVWHIDHIVPCTAFSLELSEDQRRCFKLRNLRPAFARENISKSDRMAGGFRARNIPKQMSLPI